MTILKVMVDDNQAEALIKLLHDAPFKTEIKDESSTVQGIFNENGSSSYERIKQIQKEIGNQELFKDIKDPTEWQREIRKEWDRDF